MKISSDLLTTLNKVLKALGGTPGDEQITLPPVLNATAMVSYPLHERTIGTTWSESGFIQQGVDANPGAGVQTFDLCILSPGIWHVLPGFSSRVNVLPNFGAANPQFGFMFFDGSGLGGEIYTGDYSTTFQWHPLTITTRELTTVRAFMNAMGAAGDVQGFFTFVALRLLH